MADSDAAARPVAAPCHGICPLPGCATIRTPTKPSTTALQRWTPVFSRRISAPRIVAKIGTVNWSVVASASGSSSNVPNMKVMLVSPTAQRSACARSRCVRSVASPGPTATQATITGIDPAWRKNSSSASPAPRTSASLMSAPIVANATTDARR